MSTPDERSPSKATQIELQFLEAVARRCPNDDRVLKPLGDLYTATGKYREGLVIDRQLVELCSHEPEVWYNLACSLALIGDHQAAFEALDAAVDRGYSDQDWMMNDEDLNSLREDPKFRAMLIRIASRERNRE